MTPTKAPAKVAKKATRKAATKKATPATPAAKKTAKKAVAKKTTTRKTATRRPVASAAPTAPPKKTASKRAAVKKVAGAKRTPTKRAPRAKSEREQDVDPFGFINGTDSSLAAWALVNGGESRADINEKAAVAIGNASGLTTRSGKPKTVSTIVGNTFLKLQEQGYTVKSSWELVPPEEVAALVKSEQRKQAAKARRASK